MEYGRTIKEFDYSEPNSDMNYQKELQNLFRKLKESFKSLDQSGIGKVSDDKLLSFLRSKCPNGQIFDEQLFKQVLQDLDRDNENKIDIEQFIQKYIQDREQMKNYLDALKQSYEKDKKTIEDLKPKILNAQKETLGKNGISQNSQIAIEIGKVDLINNFISEDCYFKIICEDDERKTSKRKINDLDFIEKITIPIKSKDKGLTIQFFSSGSLEPLGEVDIPLISMIENEEVSPAITISDSSENPICSINPKILFTTSYFTVYQNEKNKAEQSLEKTKPLIQEISSSLEKISLPFKYIFEESDSRGIIGKNNALQNKMIDQFENFLKKNLRLQSVKWLNMIKYILYFCIFTFFFTTLDKPDFVSLFIELVILVVIASDTREMTNTFFDNFYYFFILILFAIAYDFIDYFCLRNQVFPNMSTITGWVKFFGFLGFLGKIGLVIFIWIAKVKYSKNGFAI